MQCEARSLLELTELERSASRKKVLSAVTTCIFISFKLTAVTSVHSTAEPSILAQSAQRRSRVGHLGCEVRNSALQLGVMVDNNQPSGLNNDTAAAAQCVQVRKGMSKYGPEQSQQADLIGRTFKPADIYEEKPVVRNWAWVLQSLWSKTAGDVS